MNQILIFAWNKAEISCLFSQKLWLGIPKLEALKYQVKLDYEDNRIYIRGYKSKWKIQYLYLYKSNVIKLVESYS